MEQRVGLQAGEGIILLQWQQDCCSLPVRVQEFGGGGGSEHMGMNTGPSTRRG